MKTSYYSRNPEKVKAANARYRAANPEKVRLARAALRERYKERAKVLKAQWRKENPAAMRIYKLNQRLRKHTNGGKLSASLALKLFKLQKGKCPCCGEPLGNDYQLDHKMPLLLGGVHEDSNVQLLRKVCNLQKSIKHPINFMQSRGFLL